VAATRADYRPQAFIDNDTDLQAVIELLQSGHFNPDAPGQFEPLVRALTSPDDPWLTLADFRSYVDAQARVAAAYRDPDRWTRMSIINTARSGRFSTDRTMQEYNREIWKLDPTPPETL
jgi:starch phosphorylase